jgi:hypothetical protein
VNLSKFVRLALTLDPAMVLRVAKYKTVKVKNKDTGKVVYKSPEDFRKNKDRYEELPHSYDRNPHGRPRKTPEPGNDYLPAPPRIPRPPKVKKLKKRVKLPKPVPQPKVPEPPKPAPRDAPIGEKWVR